MFCYAFRDSFFFSCSEHTLGSCCCFWLLPCVCVDDLVGVSSIAVGDMGVWSEWGGVWISNRCAHWCSIVVNREEYPLYHRLIECGLVLQLNWWHYLWHWLWKLFQPQISVTFPCVLVCMIVDLKCVSQFGQWTFVLLRDKFPKWWSTFNGQM